MPISFVGLIARVFLVLLLLLTAAVYARGWAAVSERDRGKPWQPLVFISGLLLLAVTLISPLESLVSQYYTARALQQLLLSELVPFLLLVSDPFRPIFTGIPVILRTRLSKWRHSPTLQLFTKPAAAWFFFVTTFWFWHDSQMIALVNRSRLAHSAEIITLLLFAGLYWWHIVGAQPRMHEPMSLLVRLMYAFIGILPIKLTGIVMLFGLETRVGGYTVPDESALMVNFFGIPLADGTAGAIIIWVVGGIMYALAAVLLTSRFIGREEDKPLLPNNPIESDDLWAAPGITRRPPRNPYGLK